jgi:hypothetical protein
MTPNVKSEAIIEEQVSVEEVNRVLDIGRILFSVLSAEEIEDIETKLSLSPVLEEIGNTSVS